MAATDAISIERKKINALKILQSFAKVHGLQYLVPVQSEVIWRKRQTLRRLFNTFVLKPVSANFDILPGLSFTPG